MRPLWTAPALLAAAAFLAADPGALKVQGPDAAANPMPIIGSNTNDGFAGSPGMLVDQAKAARCLAAATYMYNGTTHDRLRSNSASPTTTFRLATVNGSGPMTSLAAAVGVGAGTAFNLGVAHSNHSVQITVVGTFTALSVTLQGSNDGVNWFNIGAAIATTGASLNFFTGSPVTQVRLNVGTFTGGTSVTGIISSQ